MTGTFVCTRFFADAQNDNERLLRMTFLVTIDAAVLVILSKAEGGVKDLNLRAE